MSVNFGFDPIQDQAERATVIATAIRALESGRASVPAGFPIQDPLEMAVHMRRRQADSTGGAFAVYKAAQKILAGI